MLASIQSPVIQCRSAQSCHRLPDLIRTTVALILKTGFTLVVLSIPSVDAADSNTQDQRLTVALLSFADKTGDPKLSHWRYSLPRMLGKPLREAKALRIYPADACDYGLRKLNCKAGDPIDSAQAKKIGEIIEARRVVRGEYSRIGDQWTMTVHVMNVSTGKESGPLIAKASDWFDVCDQVAGKILKELNMDPIEQTESVRNRIRFTTSSTALEFYSQSYALMIENKPLVEQEALSRKAVAADPKCAAMRVGLAGDLLNQGKLEEATKEIHEAIKLNYDLSGPHGMLGYLMMIQNRHDEAGRYYREALRLNSDEPEIHARVAEYHFSQGAFKEAASCLREALRLDPVSAPYRAILGNIYARQGDKNKALIELKEAEYLGIDEVNSLQMAALAYEKLNQVPQAIDCYEKFLTLARAQGLHPKLVDPYSERLVKLKASLTPVYVSAAEPKVYTEKSLREALLTRLSKDEMALINLSLASTPEMKRWAEKLTDGATTDLEKARKLYDALACRLDPGPGGSKTAQETFADWEKPQASFRCQEYARLYVALAREVGLKAFYVIIEKDFQGDVVLHACAGVLIDGKALLVDPSYRWFGIPHQQFDFQDDYEATVNHLNQIKDLTRLRLAVKLQPDSALSQFNLAVMLMTSRQLEEAGQVLQTALKLDSESGLAQYAQGLMNYFEGRPEAALLQLRKAVETHSRINSCQYYLARVLWDLGRLQESRDAFRECLKYRPDSHTEASARHAIAMINEKVGAEYPFESAGTAAKDAGESSDEAQPVPEKPDFDHVENLQKIVDKAHLLGWLKERGPEGAKQLYEPYASTPYTGWIKELSRNGKLVMLSYCRNGKPEGPCANWYENGRKAREGYFKNGKQDGPTFGWYDNGVRATEGNYKDGKLDGPATEWHENGRKAKEGHFKDGMREGLWTSWDENGKVREQVRFENGIALLADMPDLTDPATLEKILSEALADGSMEIRGPEGAKLFFEAKAKSPYTGWIKTLHENGKVVSLGYCRDGWPDGPYLNWHKNGQKAEQGVSHGGKLDGALTLWSENGQKIQESTYKAGQLNGPYARWHENGTKAEEGAFKDGKLDGPGCAWYENGTKAEQGIYKDGKLDGPVAKWHENGQKSEESAFIDGKQTGPVTQWHENGAKAGEATFKDGQLEGAATRWDENGKVLELGHYKNGKQVFENEPDLADAKTLKNILGKALKWEALKKDELTGLYHLPDKQEPYTGWIHKLHGNGKVELLGALKDGMPDGLWTWWDENGIKEDEKRYTATSP